MNRFLEELKKANLYEHNMPDSSDIERKYAECRAYYNGCIGDRFLYVSFSDKTPRVVTLVGVYKTYVLLESRYWTRDGWRAVRTAATFGALISGDDRLGDTNGR